MNHEHIIEEVRAIAHKAVDDILAVLSLGTDTVQLAQQRLADLTEVQQLVLEDDTDTSEKAQAKRNATDRKQHPNGMRPFTDAEDAAIIWLTLSGHDARHIAQVLGRPHTGIRMRRHRLRLQGKLPQKSA